MPGSLAYLLTWTCHGTWLHGDPRGSVDDEHNTWGTPVLAFDAARFEEMERRMRGGEVVLSPPMRAIVTLAIRDHCDVRGWKLHAVNVRTNHAHVVVSGEHEPEQILGQLKSWGTRRLRVAKAIGATHRPWTNGGSTRYLWDLLSLQAAIRYVREGQSGTGAREKK